MISRSDYLKALREVARSAGVSTNEVEASFRRCLKKGSASAEEFFLMDSVITPDAKKVARRSADGRLPRGCAAVAR